MYHVQFTSPITIQAVYNDDNYIGCVFGDDVDDIEKKRIAVRFEREVLKRMESWLYNKDE